MRFSFVLLCILTAGSISFGQYEFPQTWVGDWKGELLWYKGNKKEPQKVTMELRIHPSDSAGQYSWQIIYGAVTTDNRPYTLMIKDTSKGHWVIDEHNGILLDQFRVGNKLCGAFTVGASTIVNNYWLEDGKLMAEFYSFSAKPIAATGNGTDESPTVDTYKVNSYQKAVLLRQ